MCHHDGGVKRSKIQSCDGITKPTSKLNEYITSLPVETFLWFNNNGTFKLLVGGFYLQIWQQ